MSFKGPYDVQFFDPHGNIIDQTVEANSFSVMENGTAIFYHDDGAMSAMASFIRIDPARDLSEPTTGKFIHPDDREPDKLEDKVVSGDTLYFSRKEFTERAQPDKPDPTGKTYLDGMPEKVMVVYKDGQPVSPITGEPLYVADEEGEYRTVREIGTYRDEPIAFDD